MSVAKSNIVDDKTVLIKPIAYYKMLVHVLRFGNRARDRRQYREVMGMLIGRLEGNPNKKGVDHVIIEDAVPVSHGGSIEVTFKPEDYITFSYIDAEYAEHDPPLFTVGWYHSHPGLKIFFSATDIKNQLGWQTPNPSAIGIVFDHTYLETPGDLGFRTFRLDDPNKGPMTGYHEVKASVEPPDNLDYYIKIMNLINSIHSREPPILELNETPDVFGDIIIPGQAQMMSKEPILELTDIMEALKNGINSLLESSMEPMIRFFNKWSQDLIKQTVETNLEMRKDIVALKDTTSSGINEIQSTVRNSITNKLYDLDSYFDDRLEGFDKNQEALKTAIAQMKSGLLEQTKKLFEEKVNAKVDEIMKNFVDTSSLLSEFKDKNSINADNLEQQQISLDKLSELIKGLETPLVEKLNSIQESLKNSLSEKLSSITENISNLNKESREFISDLDTTISIMESSQQGLKTKIDSLKSESTTLQSIKTEKEELSKKVVTLESEKQELASKIKALEDEKLELLDKIKSLEGGQQ